METKRYEFGVGTYKTRDGREARVEFVMQEPSEDNHVLVGQVRCRDSWHHETRTIHGIFFDGHGASPRDLVPPTTTKWKAYDRKGFGESFIVNKTPLYGGGTAYFESAEFTPDGCIIPSTIKVHEV